MSDSSLALLIDGDNVSPKVIAGLLAEIAKYGTASVRRIYGDWTTPSLGGWKTCLLNYSITPVQQFSYTTGKNATDGAMIIDAMDLLYTGRFSSFCIVSSDSDFTRLASRIREQGVIVYGFGERKTNNAFIAACDKFTYFDVLNAEPEEPDVLPPTSPKSGIAPIAVRPKPISKMPIDAAASNMIALAVENCKGSDDNWVNLAAVGIYLNKIAPNLNARNYGYDRLREFVEATGLVNVKYKDMGDKPPVALVRLKQDHEKGIRRGSGSRMSGVIL